MSLLALGSTLVYFVLAASVCALLPALLSWGLLRWSTGCPVPFNRVYLACLLWTFLGTGATLVLFSLGGLHGVPARQALLSPWLRGAMLLDMAIGAVLLWRLVPRGDGRRIRLGSACMCVAAVTALALVAAFAVLR